MKISRKAKIKKDVGERKSSKRQIKEQNRTLKNVFLILGTIILISAGTFLFFYNLNSFEYRGIKFDVLNEGGITFYHTSFPAIINGTEVDYNVYIRNDPRKLEKEIHFEGSMYLPLAFVVNNTENFICDGDGGISMYNLNQVFNAFRTDLIKDPDATCDAFGRYGYLQVQEGNLSGVGQFGPACYLLQINNCEILKVTERFLVEALVKNNEMRS